MARYSEHDTSRIYEAAGAFRNNGLLRDGSVLFEQASLWRPECRRRRSLTAFGTHRLPQALSPSPNCRARLPIAVACRLISKPMAKPRACSHIQMILQPCRLPNQTALGAWRMGKRCFLWYCPTNPPRRQEDCGSYLNDSLRRVSAAVPFRPAQRHQASPPCPVSNPGRYRPPGNRSSSTRFR